MTTPLQHLGGAHATDSMMPPFCTDGAGPLRMPYRSYIYILCAAIGSGYIDLDSRDSAAQQPKCTQSRYSWRSKEWHSQVTIKNVDLCYTHGTYY